MKTIYRKFARVLVVLLLSGIARGDEGPTCQKHHPALEIAPHCNQGGIGSEVRYEIKVSNTNTGTCTVSNFEIFSEYPLKNEYFTAEIVPSSLSLLPGEGNAVSLVMKSQMAGNWRTWFFVSAKNDGQVLGPSVVSCYQNH